LVKYGLAARPGENNSKHNKEIAEKWRKWSNLMSSESLEGKSPRENPKHNKDTPGKVGRFSGDGIGKSAVC
jgi:hypothetical protein